MEDSDSDGSQTDPGRRSSGRGARSLAKISGQALARKRVSKLLREKRRQRRREDAQKQEEADEIVKRSHRWDDYVEKTRQRVKDQKAAMVEEAEKQASDAHHSERREFSKSQEELEAFAELSRQRVVHQNRLREELRAKENKREKEMQRGFGTEPAELKEFRSKTRDRIVEKMWSKLPNIREGFGCLGPPPCRKIAVVGAGPVGLWTAVMILRKYIRADNGESGCLMRPDAPEVVIFESRQEEQHRSRVNIRIALSASTQKLMNRYTDPEHGHSKEIRFASGMTLAEIETALLKELRRICASQQCIIFGRGCTHPRELADEGFDCVLWAAGRRSLDDKVRAELKCESRIGDAEQVLVFSLPSLGGSGEKSGEPVSPGSLAEHRYVEALAATDLSLFAQRASGLQTLRIMLRPGFGGGVACWLWLLGLPEDVAPAKGPPKSNVKKTSLEETLTDVLVDAVAADSESLPALTNAMTSLQQKLKPRGKLEVRWVEASYWSADAVVCSVEPRQRCISIEPPIPVVLLGDSACGKPFYTGTTLNQHIWDVAGLVDSMEWAHNGKPMTAEDFNPYEKRYQTRLRKNRAFQRVDELSEEPFVVPNNWGCMKGGLGRDTSTSSLLL